MSTTTWLTDANGNKASIEYWGSQEAAQRALDSLDDCANCSDCSDCSDCSRLKGAAPVKATSPPIPTIDNIHQRVYEAVSQLDALDMGAWHACESTHCRGGWVIALAGEAGRELERFHNTQLAAMLIYDASDPSYRINPARFFDSNEKALADMKRLAEATA